MSDVAAKMEKLKLHTPDLTARNVEKIAALFPDCITEARDENGNLTRAVDFDQLRQELSTSIVEGPRERYHLDWPGKREALLAANAPIAKTLRPCREESVDFDTTKNIFIEGDNLDALKLLQETYLNKVKLIYIDPPYNTGNDFLYNDDFSEGKDSYLFRSNQQDVDGNRMILNPTANGRFHSDWLTMIYPRLKLARNLLRDDGLIFVSIDDVEITNVRKVLDEIFGEKCLIAELVWKNKYNAGALTKGFSSVHEYILCYAKSEISNITAPLGQDEIAQYKGLDAKAPTRGGYVTQPLATNSKDSRPNLRYPIIIGGREIWPEKQWIWSRDRIEAAIANDEVVVNETNGKVSVRVKQYLRDENGRMREMKPLSILIGPYNQQGTKEIAEIFGEENMFSFPKPVDLLRYIVSLTVNETKGIEPIILDFFAGSGTMGQAVMEQNAVDSGTRRYILVQLPEVVPLDSAAAKAGFKEITELTKERLRRAAQINHDKNPLFSGDTGFRVLKIDTSNMKDVYYTPGEIQQRDLLSHLDNIREDRTPEDLLFQVLVDWGIDLALPIATETIAGKTVFFVDGNALAACFDSDISEDLVKELAKRKPLRAVFRDSSYGSDSVKINVEQIFRLLAPSTEIKSL
jgi:adenine-specific DNA-methyltransferase